MRNGNGMSGEVDRVSVTIEQKNTTFR